MSMNRRSLLTLVAALLACDAGDKPRDPVWGKEPCAHCRMLVQDRLHAAQAFEHSERYFFDDIGCLVLWERRHAGARSWVRDGASDGWLDAGQARYRSGATTPMDFGFEARSDGGPLGWGDVKARAVAKEEGR